MGLFLKNADAQLCSPLSIAPNVCLFGINTSFTGPSSQPLCASTNNNPFAVRSYTSVPSVSGEACGLAAQQDGKTCIQMYARFQCSAYCVECGLKPCANFCAVIATECPTANQMGCFDPNLLSVTCAPQNTNNCVNWKVDQSKLPDPVTTTKTTTSSQSTLTSTTVQHTTSSSSSSSVGSLELGLLLGSIIIVLQVFGLE